MRGRQSYSFPVSSENVAVVRAIFEGGASTSKEAMLAALPQVVPVLFHPDAEWIEAPERVDSRTYRGHDGIRQSFEHWLEQWEEYRVTAERFEDYGDQVLVVVHESGEGHGSGASTKRRSTQSSRSRTERSASIASSTTKPPPRPQ
jgi:ketosteroid isomerase-like protein